MTSISQGHDQTKYVVKNAKLCALTAFRWVLYSYFMFMQPIWPSALAPDNLLYQSSEGRCNITVLKSALLALCCGGSPDQGCGFDFCAFLLVSNDPRQVVHLHWPPIASRRAVTLCSWDGFTGLAESNGSTLSGLWLEVVLHESVYGARNQRQFMEFFFWHLLLS